MAVIQYKNNIFQIDSHVTFNDRNIMLLSSVDGIIPIHAVGENWERFHKTFGKIKTFKSLIEARDFYEVQVIDFIRDFLVEIDCKRDFSDSVSKTNYA